MIYNQWVEFCKRRKHVGMMWDILLGIQKIDLRGLKCYAASNFRSQIEFKIFFCFMELDIIAWFDLNWCSKIHFKNLFFQRLDPPW